MSILEIHGSRTPDGRSAGPPRTGRMQPTGPELGDQARASLWRFSAGTRTQGATRDRLGVATVRNQYPATKGLFSDAALMAVLRPPGRDRCSWDHYRKLAGDLGEPPPVPSPELFGLLGRQCRGCRTHYAAQVVAAREEAFQAAGGRRLPNGRVRTPDGTARLRRVGGEPSVRELIVQARRRQQQREELRPR
jgi:hypothetical protein